MLYTEQPWQVNKINSSLTVSLLVTERQHSISRKYKFSAADISKPEERYLRKYGGLDLRDIVRSGHDLGTVWCATPITWTITHLLSSAVKEAAVMFPLPRCPTASQESGETQHKQDYEISDINLAWSQRQSPLSTLIGFKLCCNGQRTFNPKMGRMLNVRLNQKRFICL